MFKQLIQKIVGTKNERELKRLRPRVEAINAFENEMRALRDEDFPVRTAARMRTERPRHILARRWRRSFPRPLPSVVRRPAAP